MFGTVQSLNIDLVRAWTGHNVRPGLARDRSLHCDLVRAWTGRNVATWSVHGPVVTLRPDPCGLVAMLRPGSCVDRSQRFDLVRARFGHYALIGLDTCPMF
ncbi:hypothetical protein F2Q70_00029845 [Brassica cretica]|uniref:Uncharacterized protein n=1 Tax=Brassica cretica TaxID=69181 RepID=A0A8S9FLP4_BRACR|nr:hypothetical protein F2Q70_00029845 [Brassica cretica]KAF2552452.1 hypothetical protein F2Q68_00034313 [Brassica cretica]